MGHRPYSQSSDHESIALQKKNHSRNGEKLVNSWNGCTESHHRINLVSLYVSISVLSKRNAFFPSESPTGAERPLLHSLATQHSPRNRSKRPQSQSKVINFSRLAFTPFDFHHYFHTNRSNYWALICGTHEHRTHE